MFDVLGCKYDRLAQSLKVDVALCIFAFDSVFVS